MPFADLLPYLGKIVTTTQFRGIANLLIAQACGHFGVPDSLFPQG